MAGCSLKGCEGGACYVEGAGLRDGDGEILHFLLFILHEVLIDRVSGEEEAR